jgi:hypothetical protein
MIKPCAQKSPVARIHRLGVTVATALILFMGLFAPTYGTAGSEGKSRIRIFCDLDCVFSLDKSDGEIAAGMQAAVLVMPGDYELEVATADGLDYWKTRVTVSEAGAEVHVPLKDERAKRIAHENGVQRLQDSAEAKRDRFSKLAEENKAWAESGTERSAIGNEIVRLIEKYSTRYEEEYAAGVSQRQKAEELKANPSPPANTGGTLLQTASTVTALQLRGSMNRHFLAASAAMSRIHQLTNLLGVLSSGQVTHARAMLREAMTFPVSWEGRGTQFWIGDAAMELTRDTQGSVHKKETAFPLGRVSFNCAQIKDVHTAGHPAVRAVKELVGTGAFVVRLASTTLSLRGADDGARQLIVGTLYLTCPSLTGDSGLIFDVDLLKGVDRLLWQLQEANLTTPSRARGTAVGVAPAPKTSNASPRSAAAPRTATPSTKLSEQAPQPAPKKQAGNTSGVSSAPLAKPAPPTTSGIYLEGKQTYQEKPGISSEFDKKLENAEIEVSPPREE